MYPRAHMTLGICLAVIIGYFWNRKRKNIDVDLYLFIILGAIGGLFPDVDNEIANLIGNPGGEWVHRSQYTHSLFGFLVWPIVIAIFLYFFHLFRKGYNKKIETFIIIYVTALSTYLSHLITDMIEDYPTPILYPFSKELYFGFIPETIHTSAIPYTIVMIGCLFISAFLIYKYYWHYEIEKKLTKKEWVFLTISLIVILYLFT